MNNPTMAMGAVRAASRVPREEPDLWNEDDIPTDDAGSSDGAGDSAEGGDGGGDGGSARNSGRVTERFGEAPDRENDAPRE